jgi:DNA-binding CsgD family transcriptional regulator
MHLDRYIEVSSSKDLATFEKRLLGMAHDLGFGLVSGALVIENLVEKDKYQYHAFGNTPQEFLDASFQASSAARDPVLKRLKELSIPFCYNQDLYVQEGAGDLWEEQAAFGYRAGVAVALHLPGHQHFLLGVDREQSLPNNGAELSRLMADLQFLAVHAQSAALSILGPKQTLQVPKFSAREIEVLKWTRSGKSAWETGQILGLSEQGVNYHMRSIFLKLDVSSKHQAVLRAIDLGMI